MRPQKILRVVGIVMLLGIFVLPESLYGVKLSYSSQISKNTLRLPLDRERIGVFLNGDDKKTSDANVTTHLTGRQLVDGLKQSEEGKKAVTMATNIRSPLSLPGIIEAAKETGSVVIFQQALSELGYTWPSGKGHEPENAYRFVAEVREACEKHNFTNYVIKGDHVTVKADKAFLEDQPAQSAIIGLFEKILAEKDNTKRIAEFFDALDDKEFMANTNVANGMDAIKKAYNLVQAEVGAGMTVFALDASFMPTPLNVRITAFLAGFIPDNCSIEAEVGEIGGKDNSTVADALEFVTGIRYAEDVERDPQTNTIAFSKLTLTGDRDPIVISSDKGLLDYGVRIDRIALNNGTAHGNNYDKDGNLIITTANLKMTAAISEALAPYGIEIVQHGITGTPLENLPALRAAGITSGHVGTNWQNIIWEVMNEEAASSPKTKKLVEDMKAYLAENFGAKYNITDLETADPKDVTKFIGKELKNALGAHKARMVLLPKQVKDKIGAATKQSAVDHFNAFGAKGTAQLVEAYIKNNGILAESSETKKEVLRPAFDILAQRVTTARGATTGEVYIDDAIEEGANGIIAGHSEPRANFQRESNSKINQQIKTAHARDLEAIILCVGETDKEKIGGDSKKVVSSQLLLGLKGLTPEQVATTIIAYEPRWAIKGSGYGKPAEPQDAQEMASFIREIIKGKFTEEVARKLRILYGGSADKSNAKNYLTQPDVDGLLVGGKSTSVDEFKPIIEIAQEIGPTQGRIPYIGGNWKSYEIKDSNGTFINALREIIPERVEVGIAPSLAKIGRLARELSAQEALRQGL